MMQLAEVLALRRSISAAAAGRPGDVDASVEYATDLAERTGEGNTYGLGRLSPIKVSLYCDVGITKDGGQRTCCGRRREPRKRT
jgi:hypothetical protein